jgi:hypothetical protein
LKLLLKGAVAQGGRTHASQAAAVHLPLLAGDNLASALSGPYLHGRLLRAQLGDARDDQADHCGCGEGLGDHSYAVLLVCGVAEIFPSLTSRAIIDPTVRL